MRKLNLLVLSLLFLISGTQATALTLEKIKYGDFSNWVTRHISESSAIGGKKIIKKVGMEMVQLDKYQGFSASISATAERISLAM